MAGLPCSVCGTESAVFMLTSMESGDTESVGANCAPGFALGFAASMSDGMTLETCEAYGKLFDQIASHDQRPKSGAADTAASGARRAKRAPASGTPASVPPDGAIASYTPSYDPGGATNQDDRPGDDMAPSDGDFPGALTLPLDDVTE